MEDLDFTQDNQASTPSRTKGLKLTCLRNADGDVVGMFSNHVIEMAARAEWKQYYEKKAPMWAPSACHSSTIYASSLPLCDVDAGDGDRVDYVCERLGHDVLAELAGRVAMWCRHGAADVVVSRFMVNKYRRPGCGSGDLVLGGPEEAAGVVYVLKIKAPK